MINKNKNNNKNNKNNNKNNNKKIYGSVTQGAEYAT